MLSINPYDRQLFFARALTHPTGRCAGVVWRLSFERGRVVGWLGMQSNACGAGWCELMHADRRSGRVGCRPWMTRECCLLRACWLEGERSRCGSVAWSGTVKERKIVRKIMCND